MISVPVRRQIPTQFLYFCHTLLPETKSPSVPFPGTGKSVFYLHGIIYDAVNPVKGLCSIRTPDRTQQWDIVILIIMGQDRQSEGLSQGSGFPPRLHPSLLYKHGESEYSYYGNKYKNGGYAVPGKFLFFQSIRLHRVNC